MEILWTVVVVVAVTGILTWVSMRQRAAAWSGVVTNIHKHSYMRNETEEEEMIISYRTDTGKSGKLKMNSYAYKQTYPDLQVGDRLLKESGQYMPRVEKAGTSFET